MLSWIPRWTNNPNFNAQAAHFGVGYGSAITIFTKSMPSHPFVGLGLMALFVAYAGLKEFWYDANYELPAQSFLDNLEDFLWYMYGMMAGLLVGSI